MGKAPAGGKSANDASTDSGPGRSATASACEPYRDFIELSLSKGRNAKAIYQDLVDDQGFAGRYQSVNRFVRHCRGTQTPEARAVILTLGYSRKCIRLLTFQSSTRTWAELHEQAFRPLGGSTKPSCSTTSGKECSSPTFTIPL